MENPFLRILIILMIGLPSLKLYAQEYTGPHGERFGMRVVADRLSDPWKVIYGPDGNLWVTEAKGYRVVTIDPVSGARTVLLDLNAQRNFPRYDKQGQISGGKPWPQAGLMAMALHPQLLSGKPYVYLFYIYHFEGKDDQGDGCKVGFGGCYFRGRLARYQYDQNSKRLINPVTLCDTIPQSNDHNGGNMAIGELNGQNYIFYGIGDMGAGQFINGGRVNKAQDPLAYEGKILRFNAEPDGDSNYYDRWIPNDNPFNGRSQSAVWTTGHRNPEGIAAAFIGKKMYIYSSEHGPFSDDEINLIVKGKNYGHPLIMGYADDNYNGLSAGVSDHAELPGKWHTSYPLIVSEKANLNKIGRDNFRSPLVSLYPTSADELQQLFAKKGKGGWRSEAPSSIAVYTSDAIPGWKNSLLVPTLKGGKMIRLKLNSDGTEVVGDTVNYFKGRQRYRDIAISPNGRKLYLAIDSTNVTSGP